MSRLLAKLPLLIPLARRLPPAIPTLGWRLIQAAFAWVGFGHYLVDRRRYRRLPEAEPLRWRDDFPQVGDRLPTSQYDSHYFFQDVWAARNVADFGPSRHVDVGSRVDYVGFLTALTKVTFVDIRPLEVDLDGLESIKGSVLDLPFADQSVESLSCLHVAEHIGLGRYGDPLDPAGTRKALPELQRVLRPGGQLLFSGPVGERRVAFNAYRVHTTQDIVAMFAELELVEFSGVDDRGEFRRHRALHELDGSRYACGMFRFVRPAAAA
jgi:SAM-dependent methyltransferase